MMAHNRPYYGGLIEQYGFRKSQDLYAFWANGEMLPPSQSKKNTPTIHGKGGAVEILIAEVIRIVPREQSAGEFTRSAVVVGSPEVFQIFQTGRRIDRIRVDRIRVRLVLCTMLV